MIRLHNTLTRQVDEFTPLEPETVRLYSCGPTVYDHVHIGNLRSFITADTLRRTLTDAGYTVRHVMNFTDVDDKTIRGSRQRYPKQEPLAGLTQLTAEYKRIFLEDMQAIGNDVDAISFVSATESVDGMRRLITELYDSGFAYIADDGVYFSIEKYQASGKRYGQLLELSSSNTGAARINNDEYDKDSVHDFALWKTKKDNEPAWEFELGGRDLTGRPGWHIECSAMSTGHLGQPFDIHTGGVDLIFPHHENEIAQSTAGREPEYANFFVHNEHLLVDGRKMSKSLNNFFTLQDISAKGYEPLAFRLLVLQSHYRHQSNFTWESLAAAQQRLTNWRSVADLRLQPQPSSSRNLSLEAGTAKAELDIRRLLQNDMDTPKALERIDSFFNAVGADVLTDSEVSKFSELLATIDKLLGLNLSSGQDITDDQKQILESRRAARAKKDWTKSDELRDQLENQGLGVRDTASGQIWYRL